MVSTTTCEILVLCPDEPARVLAEAASAHSWPIASPALRRDAVQYARAFRPSAALVQVTDAGLSHCLELLDVLRDRCAGLHRLAWSPCYDADLERAVRQVGVQAYAAAAEGLDLFEQLVVARPPRAAPKAIRAGPPRPMRLRADDTS